MGLNSYILGAAAKDRLPSPVDNSIGYWLLSQDYISGSTVDDLSSLSHDGTISGSPTAVADRHGSADSALQFDDVTEYVDMGDFADHQPVDITLAFWLYVDSFSGDEKKIVGNLYQGASYNDGYDIALSATGTKILGRLGTYSANIQLEYAIGVSTWYHVALTFSDSADEQKLYIGESGSATEERDSATEASQLYYPSALSFRVNRDDQNIRVCQVVLYDQALNLDQIQRLMNKT